MTAARRKKSGKEASATIGIIGGSGLYSMPGLKDTREIRVKTPFGEPSDAIVVGTLEEKRVAFLARHGRGHRILPSEINFRANICAMKQLGVERIISVSCQIAEDTSSTAHRGAKSARRPNGWGFRHTTSSNCALRTSLRRIILLWGLSSRPQQKRTRTPSWASSFCAQPEK